MFFLRSLGRGTANSAHDRRAAIAIGADGLAAGCSGERPFAVAGLASCYGKVPMVGDVFWVGCAAPAPAPGI
jgi:hypothetical protein